MRRLALGLGVLTAAALVFVATSPAAHAARVNCKQKKVVILLWPGGHNAIPSVDFPEFLSPHLEVYRPGPPFPDSRFLAFAGAGGGQFARSCKASSATVPTGIAAKSTIATMAALSCELPLKGILDRVDFARKSILRLFAGMELYAKVTITTQGTIAVYNSKVCEPGPAPS